MNNLTKLALIVAALGACGDNKKPAVDAPEQKKDAAIDAPPSFPAAPTLGTPIDRMGRPAINTALNALTEMDATKKAAKKDAYNHANPEMPQGWSMVQLDPAVAQDIVLVEFASTIAVFDAADTGMPAQQVPGAGCGNAVGYNQLTNANATLHAYGFLGIVLADDELYVDTAKGQCNFYLDLEVEKAAAVAHQNCGGRTPVHDVIDSSYSVLAAGVAGFDALNNFAPRLGDGVGPHSDVSTTDFPFLGAPH